MPSYFFVSHSSTIVSVPPWFHCMREGLWQVDETYLGRDIEVRLIQICDLEHATIVLDKVIVDSGLS